MNERSKKFVAQYAKAMDLTLTDAEDRIVEIGASRINALRKYAVRLKAGEVSPPSRTQPKAKPAPKAKAPAKKAPAKKDPPKAKAPKARKAKSVEPVTNPAPVAKVSAMDEGGEIGED